MQGVAFDRTTLLFRTSEQADADRQMQEESAERLRPKVTDSLSIAQYKAAIGAETAAKETVRQGFEMMADAYFWQCRFEEAAETVEDQQAKAEYAMFRDAYSRLDDPQCECPPRQISVQGSAKGQTLPARREVQRVYDGMSEIVFIRCDVCSRFFAQRAR